MLSLFGSGFIGSAYVAKYKRVYIEPRWSIIPKYDNVLLAYGTSDNYNIFTETPTIDFDVNVCKLIRILNNCKGRKIEFTLLSSWFVYAGSGLNTPHKEDDLSNALGYYSISKKAAENVLITFCRLFDKEFNILRLANIYGPGDKKVSAKKNALTYLINKLKNNEDVQLYDDGNFTRNFLFIDDCVEAIKLIIDKGEKNQIYNVGANLSYNFGDLIRFCKKELNSKSKITSISPPKFHGIVQMKNIDLDTSKLFRLGFKPKVSILDGLRTLF